MENVEENNDDEEDYQPPLNEELEIEDMSDLPQKDDEEEEKDDNEEQEEEEAFVANSPNNEMTDYVAGAEEGVIGEDISENTEDKEESLRDDWGEN